MLYERITADEVRVGDFVAQAQHHTFNRVVAVEELPDERRLWFGQHPSDATRPGAWCMRLRRAAKVWRYTGA